LRRELIDEHGNPKDALSRGQQKSFQTDRVVLVPGPAQEQDVVRRMYRMFVEDGCSESEIAETLNTEGHLTDLDRPWSRASVHQVLTNEKYIGNNVYNKVSFKLKHKRVVNPREMWIRAEGALGPFARHIADPFTRRYHIRVDCRGPDETEQSHHQKFQGDRRYHHRP
jgi:hypothetical protein